MTICHRIIGMAGPSVNRWTNEQHIQSLRTHNYLTSSQRNANYNVKNDFVITTLKEAPPSNKASGHQNTPFAGQNTQSCFSNTVTGSLAHNPTLN